MKVYRTQSEVKVVTSHKDKERQLCSSGEITFLPEVILSKRWFPQKNFGITERFS